MPSVVRFVGLCLRFAEDFETSLDDWKPDMTDGNRKNLCAVSDGTYEVCSRTIAQKQDKSGMMRYFDESNIKRKETHTLVSQLQNLPLIHFRQIMQNGS